MNLPDRNWINSVFPTCRYSAGDRFQMRLRIKRLRGLTARLPQRALQRALVSRRQTRPLPRPPLPRGGEGWIGGGDARDVAREERRRDRLQEGRGRPQRIGGGVGHFAEHASKENVILIPKHDDE